MINVLFQRRIYLQLNATTEWEIYTKMNNMFQISYIYAKECDYVTTKNKFMVEIYIHTFQTVL